MKKTLFVSLLASLCLGFAAQAQTQNSNPEDTQMMSEDVSTPAETATSTEHPHSKVMRDWATTPNPYPGHYPHPVPPPPPAPYPVPYPPTYPPPYPPAPVPYYPPQPVPYPTPMATCYARGNTGVVYYGTSYTPFQASQIAMNICCSTGQICQPVGCQ